MPFVFIAERAVSVFINFLVKLISTNEFVEFVFIAEKTVSVFINFLVRLITTDGFVSVVFVVEKTVCFHKFSSQVNNH